MSTPGASSPPNNNSPKTTSTSRDSEIALIEKISTSLQTYIGDHPVPARAPAPLLPLPAPVTSGDGGRAKPTASDASKSAAKSFLATKTLVKSLAKACVQEGAAKDAATMEIETEGPWPGTFDSLVERYEGKYPALTRRMLVDGITRYSAQHGDGPAPAEAVDPDVSAELHELQKLARIIVRVDDEMHAYHAKIDALRKARERAAAAPAPAAPPAAPDRKRKRKSRAKGAVDGAPAEKKPPKPKVPPKPRPARVPKDPQEALYVDEIVKKYAVARASYGRLPNGVFATLAEEVRQEQGLEGTDAVDLTLLKLEQKVRFKYLHGIRKAGGDVPVHRNHAIFEEVYRRYSRTKEANGGKLPPGRMDQIVEGVKLEFGMEDVECPESLKTRCQARFTKTHPEFDSNGPAVIKLGALNAEDKRRRQLLLNEVTARYVREKEAHPRKLADGTLDRIIDVTKVDLGITEFEVKKETIRGRINRNSFFVRTLGKDSPYDQIDGLLVETLNGWLGQGLSVTRAQGLDLANRLMKERRLQARQAKVEAGAEGREDGGGGEEGKEDGGGGGAEAQEDDGEDIILNAPWWRNFLERNKKKLVCADDADGE